MRDFLTRRLLRPLQDQLGRGASPDALARAVTLGVLLGLFPFLGTTTLLCALAAAWGGLNQPAVQTANYAVSGLQILLIPVFVKAGEHLFGLVPVTFDVRRLPGEFMADPMLFLRNYGRAALLAAPGLLYLFRRWFRIMGTRFGTRFPGATTPSERTS